MARIDYVELPSATAHELTRAFYAKAFGWTFTDYGPGYAGIQKSGGEAGGVRLGSGTVTGGPLVILYSRDLDETLEAVRSAGGEVTKEPFDFPGGRRFHFKDPSGNELAVWSDR